MYSSKKKHLPRFEDGLQKNMWVALSFVDEATGCTGQGSEWQLAEGIIVKEGGDLPEGIMKPAESLGHEIWLPHGQKQ